MTMTLSLLNGERMRRKLGPRHKVSAGRRENLMPEEKKAVRKLAALLKGWDRNGRKEGKWPSLGTS